MLNQSLEIGLEGLDITLSPSLSLSSPTDG